MFNNQLLSACNPKRCVYVIAEDGYLYASIAATMTTMATNMGPAVAAALLGLGALGEGDGEGVGLDEGLVGEGTGDGEGSLGFSMLLSFSCTQSTVERHCGKVAAGWHVLTSAFHSNFYATMYDANSTVGSSLVCVLMHWCWVFSGSRMHTLELTPPDRRCPCTRSSGTQRRCLGSR
jgi:hypothetical protein